MSYDKHTFIKLSAKRKIELIYECMRQLETARESKPPNHQIWTDVTHYFTWLAEASDPVLQSIANLKRILHSPHLEPHELQNILVALERYLDRSVADHDFVILDQDHAISQQEQRKIDLILILDHLRSAFNVGSIFRTAECLGLQKIILAGYTPSPGSNSKLQQTTMGTEDAVAWEVEVDLHTAIDKVKKNGYVVYGFETTTHAQDLYDVQFAEKSCFLFGNERFGLNPTTLRHCDITVKIPVRGLKNSLNVANAVAISGYEFLRQQNPDGLNGVKSC